MGGRRHRHLHRYELAQRQCWGDFPNQSFAHPAGRILQHAAQLNSRPSLLIVMFRILFVLFVLATGIFALSRATAADVPRAAEPRQSYKLQPMDLIKVQVYQEPELERELRVSSGRTVVLPLIGTVDLKNRTVNEAEQLITELYDKDYLVNPQINITVMEYAPRTVNILGAVNTPGSVQIPP